MSIIHFRLSFKSIILSILLLGIIYTSAYQFSDSFKMRVSHSITDIENITNMNLSGSWGVRAAFWITTYNIIKKHPFGVGAGDYEIATREELKTDKYTYLENNTKKFMGRTHQHNYFLMTVTQTGIIGLIMFLMILLYILKLKIKDKDIKELSILFVVVFILSSMAEPLLYKHFTIGLFILFIGLFAKSSIIEKPIK